MFVVLLYFFYYLFKRFILSVDFGVESDVAANSFLRRHILILITTMINLFYSDIHANNTYFEQGILVSSFDICFCLFCHMCLLLPITCILVSGNN